MKTVVTTLAIQLGNNSRYIDQCKNLVSTNLQYTNFDIIVLTNKPQEFNEFESDRLTIVDYDANYTEPLISGKKFNMHLKRYAIRLGADAGHDIVFYNDADAYLTGWDQKSFEEKCSKDFDMATPSNIEPQFRGLRLNNPMFQDKVEQIKDLWYDELDNAPNISEVRVVFKNNNKLKTFLYFWDAIASRNTEYRYFTYFDGVYFGMSAVHAKMKLERITRNSEFTNMCRINHTRFILDFFGVKIERVA